MVSASAITGIIFTLIITLIVPVVIWIIFAKKVKGISKAIIAGALGFIIPQLFIRIPILQLLGTNQSVVQFSEGNKYLFLLILAFSAGLFETTGRLIVLKVLSKNELSYYSSLGAGYGHGAAEAVGLIGLTYVNNLIFAVMINTGSLPTGDEYESIKETFLSTSSSLFYAAGIERILTVVFHIALTVLFAYMISKKKTLAGFILCVAIHTLLDFSVVAVNAVTQNVWVSLIVLSAFTVISSVIIIKVKNKFNIKEMPKDPAEKALEEGY
ncbi:MAG: YhfC family glutamic-type intramembrane protease [Clostridia bacterium]|nr:YhfC family glutamic-type intramembrane protease [Clostridia bacterium]